MHDEEFGEGASGDLLVSSSCFNSFPLAFLLMQRFLLDLSGYRIAAVDVRVELYNLALDFLLAEATPATPCSLYGVSAFQNAAMTDRSVDRSPRSSRPPRPPTVLPKTKPTNKTRCQAVLPYFWGETKSSFR